MSGSPTKSDLERRLEALINTIEKERSDRRAESAAASARIAELEAKLAAAPPTFIPTSAGSGGISGLRRTPTGTASTTPKRPTSATGGVKSTEASPVSPSAPRSAGKAPSTISRFSSSQRSGKASPASAQRASPIQDEATATAAREAWDKLCVKAREDFTVKELWLVSLDTLRQLLLHYGMNDPVECAQVECQWALLQEGKEHVENPTPKKLVVKRAAPFSPLKHPSDFDLRNGPGKPSLSARSNLSADTTARPSDPNDSVIRGRSVSPGSKGALRIDAIQGSNPNDSMSPGRYHLGKKTWDAPPSTIHRVERTRGKNREHSPMPEGHIEAYPQRESPSREGVKRFQRQMSPESHHRGLRTGYVPPSERLDRHGLRTVPTGSGGGLVQWSHA